MFCFFIQQTESLKDSEAAKSDAADLNLPHLIKRSIQVRNLFFFSPVKTFCKPMFYKEKNVNLYYLGYPNKSVLNTSSKTRLSGKTIIMHPNESSTCVLFRPMTLQMEAYFFACSMLFLLNQSKGRKVQLSFCKNLWK